MRTIEKARAMLVAAPGEALHDVAGMAALALTIFFGFSLIALI